MNMSMFVMAVWKKLALLACLLFLLPAGAWAAPADSLTAVFPYAVQKDKKPDVYQGGSNALYITVTSAQPVLAAGRVTVLLPAGLLPGQLPPGWRLEKSDGQAVLVKNTDVPANYGAWFDLLPLYAGHGMAVGQHMLEVSVELNGKVLQRSVSFDVAPVAAGAKKNAAPWTIENILLPVDKDGIYDEKFKKNLIYINDWALEDLRSRFKGKGSANLAALEAHPIGYVLLEIANPSLDSGVIRIKSQLLDKKTGLPAAGLRPSGDLSEGEGAEAWQQDTGEHASLAMAALGGQPRERYILPLYADSTLAAGSYTINISVEGGGRQQEAAMSLDVVARRSSTMYALGFAAACTALFAAVFTWRIRGWLDAMKAKGVITVSLFAAVAFGGVTLPTTLFDDILRAFLGPFAALASGIFSSAFYYLLLTALVMLYPKPGTAAVMMLLRWVLGALLLGRITPVSIAFLCTQAVIVESFLWLAARSGGQAGVRQKMTLAVFLGLADAVSTYVHLELLMFFYRLYYADWYIGLYVVVCGFLYTAAGCWLGYALGGKLRYVTGE